MKTIYPWQQQQWRQFQQLLAINRLPTSLILAGEKSLGKFQFASQAAALILCESRTNQICGSCQSCHWLMQSVHPDLHIICPQTGSDVIKIDQIRELIIDIQQSAHQQYKIVIVNPAEAMNIAAVNALLKTLEEPVGKTIFFLIANNYYLLPATLVSRCMLFKFSSPEFTIGLQWLSQQTHHPQAHSLLKLAGGLPLLAYQWWQEKNAEEYLQLLLLLIEVITGRQFVISVAEKIREMNYLDFLWLTYQLVADLIQAQMNSAGDSDLQSIAAKLDIIKLYQLLDEINQLRRIGLRHIAVNQQLQIEALLIKMQRLAYSVIPAHAGIQESRAKTGFPHARE